MEFIKKLARLPRVVAYNLDWYRYLPFAGKANSGVVERFRLRNGQVLDVKRDGRFVLNEIYLDRVYDLPNVSYSGLRHILDLGANIGLFATYVASQNPLATVHCFEPSADNFALLKRNVERNLVNARLYQTAVAVNEGVGLLSRRGSSVEYGLVEQADDTTEEVKCIAMDRVFELCGTERFDLAKIDIEGFEKQLIDAASDEWLRRFDHLMMEWHHSRDELESIGKRLRGIGFEAEPIYEDGQMPFLRASLRNASF